MTGNIMAKRLAEDLKLAVKERNKERVDVLRMLLNALKNAELDEREELSEEQELAVISSYARRIRESITDFEKGDRPDLVAKEKRELEIVVSYLPKQMSEEEIRKAASEIIAELGAVSPREVGRVIGEVMKRFKGRADGATVNRIVSELLSRG